MGVRNEYAPIAGTDCSDAAVTDQGPGAFCLRSSHGRFLSMDAHGKLRVHDKMAADAHRQTVFRIMTPK